MRLNVWRGEAAVFLKTEKLTIRKMTTEDLFPLYHVPSDSEVMEYPAVFHGSSETIPV